ncbi:MAG: hypothetical protein AB9866_11000 [Syntrophobacteraceae bacterium]
MISVAKFKYGCMAGLAAMILLFALMFLAGCATTSTTGTGTAQPSPTAIARDATAWIGGLAATIIQNGPGAIASLCTAGVMSEEDCALAKLGMGLGTIFLPSFVGVAQNAAANFQAAPTVDNQEKLKKAMTPVYTAAKVANTK